MCRVHGYTGGGGWGGVENEKIIDTVEGNPNPNSSTVLRERERVREKEREGG